MYYVIISGTKLKAAIAQVEIEKEGGIIRYLVTSLTEGTEAQYETVILGQRRLADIKITWAQCDCSRITNQNEEFVSGVIDARYPRLAFNLGAKVRVVFPDGSNILYEMHSFDSIAWVPIWESMRDKDGKPIGDSGFTSGTITSSLSGSYTGNGNELDFIWVIKTATSLNSIWLWAQMTDADSGKFYIQYTRMK